MLSCVTLCGLVVLLCFLQRTDNFNKLRENFKVADAAGEADGAGEEGADNGQGESTSALLPIKRRVQT